LPRKKATGKSPSGVLKKKKFFFVGGGCVGQCVFEDMVAKNPQKMRKSEKGCVPMGATSPNFGKKAMGQTYEGVLTKKDKKNLVRDE